MTSLKVSSFSDSNDNGWVTQASSSSLSPVLSKEIPGAINDATYVTKTVSGAGDAFEVRFGTSGLNGCPRMPKISYRARKTSGGDTVSLTCSILQDPFGGGDPIELVSFGSTSLTTSFATYEEDHRDEVWPPIVPGNSSLIVRFTPANSGTVEISALTLEFESFDLLMRLEEPFEAPITFSPSQGTFVASLDGGAIWDEAAAGVRTFGGDDGQTITILFDMEPIPEGTDEILVVIRARSRYLANNTDLNVQVFTETERWDSAGAQTLVAPDSESAFDACDILVFSLTVAAAFSSVIPCQLQLSSYSNLFFFDGEADIFGLYVAFLTTNGEIIKAVSPVSAASSVPTATLSKIRRGLPSVAAAAFAVPSITSAKIRSAPVTSTAAAAPLATAARRYVAPVVTLTAEAMTPSPVARRKTVEAVPIVATLGGVRMTRQIVVPAATAAFATPAVKAARGVTVAAVSAAASVPDLAAVAKFKKVGFTRGVTSALKAQLRRARTISLPVASTPAAAPTAIFGRATLLSAVALQIEALTAVGTKGKIVAAVQAEATALPPAKTSKAYAMPAVAAQATVAAFTLIKQATIGVAVAELSATAPTKTAVLQAPVATASLTALPLPLRSRRTNVEAVAAAAAPVSPVAQRRYGSPATEVVAEALAPTTQKLLTAPVATASAAVPGVEFRRQVTMVAPVVSAQASAPAVIFTRVVLLPAATVEASAPACVVSRGKVAPVAVAELSGLAPRKIAVRSAPVAEAALSAAAPSLARQYVAPVASASLSATAVVRRIQVRCPAAVATFATAQPSLRRNLAPLTWVSESRSTEWTTGDW